MRTVTLEGGSEFGVGYWSNVLGRCARYATLVERGPTPEYLLVGAIGHTMLAEWFRSDGKAQLRDYRIVDPVLGDLTKSKAYGEAARCYRAYIKNFPDPKRFGRVLAVEKVIDIFDATSVSLTIKPDLIVLGKKRQRWQVDHKFVAQITPEVVAHYLESLNAVVYLEGTGMGGIIYNFISKEKDPAFATAVRLSRSDDPARLAALVRTTRRADVTEVNPTACHRWENGRPVTCPFYKKQCFGY